MAHQEIEDRTIDDIGNVQEFNLARRISAAFRHPDCPTLVLDHEAMKLSRFISLRLCRMKGPKQ